MKTIYVATKNDHKLKEITEILDSESFDVLGVGDFPDYESPDETGSSFIENAQIKARALKDFLKAKGKHDFYVLADDSGLECEDLDGAPGIHSARFAGPDATDEQNNQKLLQEFQNVTHHSRAAQYACAIVLIDPNGEESEILENCTGRIVMTPKGKNGFGYDPYFFLEELDKTMAELTSEEKNKISHRGKALRRLVGFIG